MAGEPLPRLSSIDIEVGRIKRNNLLYKKEVEAQRARVAAWAEASPSNAEPYDMGQKAWELKNKLRPPIEPASSVPPVARRTAQPLYPIDKYNSDIRPAARSPITAAKNQLSKIAPDVVLDRLKPNPANLAPTPATAGRPVYPDYEPLNTRPAAPRQPLFKKLPNPLPFADDVATLDVIPNRLPSSLPITLPPGAAKVVAGANAAGKVLGPIGVGIDAGSRIVAGQNAAQVAVGVAGGLAGAYAGAQAGAYGGAVAGAFLGPAGAAVGGVVGGIVGGVAGGLGGGRLADLLTGANRPRSAESVPLPQQGIMPPPFQGGQSQTSYDVSFSYDEKVGSGSPVPRTGMLQAFGKILSIELQNGPPDEPGINRIRLRYVSNTGAVINNDAAGGNYPSIKWSDLRNIIATRTDGQPDTGGDPPGQLAPPVLNPQGRNQLQLSLPPSAVPTGVQGSPSATPNAQGAPIATPSAVPNGGTQRGDSPDWVPTGTPAPGLAPSPNVSPQPLGPPLPETGSPARSPQSDPTYRPQNTPVARGTTHPGTGGTMFPGAMNPALLVPLAAGIAIRGKIRPTAFRDVNPMKAPDPPDFNIPGNTCNLDPCMRGVQQQTQATNDRLSQLLGVGNLGAEGASTAAILARLDAIDAKLGPQVNGGIGGLLSNVSNLLNSFSQSFEKFAKWAHLDRALNLLTTIATLHNAYMLSNGLSQTLFSMISNSLAVFGVKDYSQDKDGQPLDIGKIFNDFINNIAKAALGAETVDGIKTEWKKYNRIYQAATNILWSFQSIGYSILGALEIIANWNALVANALKKFGVVGERAYKWFNPEVNFQNRFFTAIDRTENFVSNVDQVAQEVLSIEDTVKQMNTQKKELDDSLKQLDDSPQRTQPPEAAKVATASTEEKTVSASPPIAVSDQSKPEAQ